MAKKSSTDTCCLTLPLVLEKWQSDRLEKRLEIARQIYNTLLRFELKKLRKLEQTERYQQLQKEIQVLREQEAKDSPEIRKLYQELTELRKDAGFTEYDFKTDIKDFYKHFKENIGSSVAVHGIASQVWTAFDRLFYGNGKAVHFKRRGDLDSVRGYSKSGGQSGGVEIIFRRQDDRMFVEWKGLFLPVKTDFSNAYEMQMLEKRIKYCRIVRKHGKNKPRWYVQLMLEGKPVVKYDKHSGQEKHPVGKGSVGIDIGPQTIAYVANNEASLQELADKVENIERQKRIIQRKIDRSRRAVNPDNFNEDGTIKRGTRLVWKKSKRYLILQKELASLQRRQAEIRKRQHTEMANHLLSIGDRFYIEDMNWKSLESRAKKTEISEKTGRFKKKKRFGKSVGNKAPAMLISILDQKLVSRGYNAVVRVPSKVLRASQYNHITKEYVKKTLNQRWNEMPDGKRVQRDLYSAFLLQHTNETRDGYDEIGLERDYSHFLELHDKAMDEVCSRSKTISSMGIARR